MIKGMVSLVFSACLFFLVPGAAAASDPLWDSVVRNVNQAPVWVAMDITVDARQFNRKGELVDSGTVWISRHYSPEGDLLQDVRSSGGFTPDTDRFLQGNFTSGFGGIFDLAGMNSGLIERDTTVTQLEGREAVLFRYAGDPLTGGIGRSQIWVDPVQSLPMKILLVPVEGEGKLKDNSIGIRFHTDSYQSWYPEKISMEGVTSGWIYRRIVLDMTLENHREEP